MYLVVATDYGVLEINYPWLPTWMGMNTKLVERLQEKLREAVCGRPMNEQTMADAHELVRTTLCELYPAFTGLPEFLDAIRQVGLRDGS